MGKSSLKDASQNLAQHPPKLIFCAFWAFQPSWSGISVAWWAWLSFDELRLWAVCFPCLQTRCCFKLYAYPASKLFGQKCFQASQGQHGVAQRWVCRSCLEVNPSFYRAKCCWVDVLPRNPRKFSLGTACRSNLYLCLICHQKRLLSEGQKSISWVPSVHEKSIVSSVMHIYSKKSAPRKLQTYLAWVGYDGVYGEERSRLAGIRLLGIDRRNWLCKRVSMSWYHQGIIRG